jgi:hypothetical protein
MLRLLAVAAAAALLGTPHASPAPLPGAATSGDRAAWRALLHWPAACERSWRENGSGSGIAGVWPVGAEGRLVAVDCSLGAYQGTSMLYLIGNDRRPTGPLRLHIYRDPGTGVPTPARETVILGTLTFARASRTLAVLDRARGAGDCGIYSTFRLAGRELVPLRTRAKPTCDGKPPFDPLRWPPLPLLAP